MKKFKIDPRQQRIYDSLIKKETKFTIDGIEFQERVITASSYKEREKLCEAKAKELFNILIS